MTIDQTVSPLSATLSGGGQGIEFTCTHPASNDGRIHPTFVS
jgi:hypothetical protein